MYRLFRARGCRFSSSKSNTAGICELFTQDARSRGSQPVVLLLPDRVCLERYLGTGCWVYQSLLDELDRRGVPVVNVGADLAGRLVVPDDGSRGSPPAAEGTSRGRVAVALARSRVGDLFAAGGHYGPEASRWVAESVARWLSTRGLP